MTEQSKSNEPSVLEKVEVSRRGFVKGLTIGTAFSAPFIASYSMDGLRVNTASAGVFTDSSSNETDGGPFGFIKFLIHKIIWFLKGGKSIP